MHTDWYYSDCYAVHCLKGKGNADLMCALNLAHSNTLVNSNDPLHSCSEVILNTGNTLTSYSQWELNLIIKLANPFSRFFRYVTD